MQCVCIVAVLDEGSGNVSALAAGTAENDTVNLRILVNYPLEGSVAVFLVDGVAVVLHVV